MSVETNQLKFYPYLVLTSHVLALVFRMRFVGPDPAVEVALYLNLYINLYIVWSFYIQQCSMKFLITVYKKQKFRKLKFLLMDVQIW